MSVSIRDVAARAGVSAASVSRALSGDINVSAHMRERVLEAARELKYAGNPYLSSLLSSLRRTSGQRFEGLAYVSPLDEPMPLGSSHPFVRYWKGAKERAALCGCNLEFFNAQAYCSAARLHEALQARGIKGVILGPLGKKGEDVDLPLEDYAVVSLGPTPIIHREDVSRVTCAFGESMSKCCEAAVKRGYRRIGIALQFREESPHTAQALGPFLVARERRPHRFPPIPPLFSRHPERCPVEVGEWLKHHQPDLVIGSDRRFLKAMRASGITCPGDVAFLSLEDAHSPSVAGVQTDFALIGAIAVDHLLSKIQLQHLTMPGTPQIVHVPGQWQEGETFPPEPAASLQRSRMGS